MARRAPAALREAGHGSPGRVGSLFRSETIANIVMFFTSRGVTQVQVAELERELERQAGLSRGAVENALQVLLKADLLGISTSGRNRICELRKARIWAKLGEVFELEREQPAPEPVGMPWLAQVVASKPRRTGFPIRPLEPEPQATLEDTEAMLAKLPVIEQPISKHRSAAPGRRK